jgi:hypothetical protein
MDIEIFLRQGYIYGKVFFKHSVICEIFLDF